MRKLKATNSLIDKKLFSGAMWLGFPNSGSFSTAGTPHFCIQTWNLTSNSEPTQCVHLCWFIPVLIFLKLSANLPVFADLETFSQEIFLGQVVSMRF